MTDANGCRVCTRRTGSGWEKHRGLECKALISEEASCCRLQSKGSLRWRVLRGAAAPGPVSASRAGSRAESLGQGHVPQMGTRSSVMGSGGWRNSTFKGQDAREGSRPRPASHCPGRPAARQHRDCRARCNNCRCSYLHEAARRKPSLACLPDEGREPGGAEDHLLWAGTEVPGAQLAQCPVFKETWHQPASISAEGQTASTPPGHPGHVQAPGPILRSCSAFISAAASQGFLAARALFRSRSVARAGWRTEISK